MKNLPRAAGVSIAALLLSVLVACATKSTTGPIVQSVCVDVAQAERQEAAYVRRKAGEFLGEAGFKLSEGACDVSVKYTSLGSDLQSSTVTRDFFWTSTTRSWNQEGMLTVRHGNAVMVEDEQVALRGYSTKQDLLGDLAWEAVKPVIRNFRPASPASR